MIDLDPQFNLTQALQSESAYQPFLDAGKTILTAFEPAPATDLFRIRTSADPAPPARNLEKVLWQYNPQTDKRLALVMGNFEIFKYSLLPDDIKLAAAKNRFLNFIRAAREEYDVILIDCNPSSSFLTRCALEAANNVLVPVRPDKFSVLGLDLLDRFIARLGMPKPPKLHVLLNAVSRSEFTETEQLLRSSRFASNTLAAEIYKSELLVARPGFHKFPVDRKVAYSATLRRNIAEVCTELARKIGL
jgi:chromosome partitioning protein